jgi:alcohol dehydrogenase class IV
MTPFTFKTTPNIVFGHGAIDQIGTLSRSFPGMRILLITDQGLMKTSIVERAVALLTAETCAVQVFADVVADPPETVIEAAVLAARQHEARVIIGLGGGSSLDVAKLVALLIGSGQPLSQIYGVGLAKGPRLPLILVPTTAGTGSEVTPISIVTTGDKEKKGVVSPLLIPDIALLDPDLTLGLPPHVTAATGIDAMVHAIEAITSASANANPVSNALAREALRLMAGHIRTAVRDGGNREARGAMLLGSMLAGQAFANSPVAAVHALAYPLGGHFHIPHGLSNALVLPEVVRFNAQMAQKHYADIAAIMFPGSTGKSELEIALRLADQLAALNAELGLPLRLRELGIAQDAIPALAEDAMKQTRLLVNNPRPVTLGDALAIYRAAW